MSVQAYQEPACQFLFGKNADEVYAKSKCSKFQVNENLETLIMVNIAFLSRKENDGFPFIDPIACNNQCHLYAYFAGNNKASYKAKSKDEKLAQTTVNRFLHLSFILSYTFAKDRNLLCKAIENAENKCEVVLPKEKKVFYDFAKDSEGTLIRTARKSLNKTFTRMFKELLASKKELSDLHKELYQIAVLENLDLKGDGSNVILYTPPKMLGVALIINEQIPFVIKSKVITSNGTANLFYHSKPLKSNDDMPVLVFEAITSDELSIEKFRETAAKCPLFFERHPSRKNRHPENETCHFCDSTKIDDEPYRLNFNRATKSIEDTLYALSADFVKEIQSPFVKFFEDKEKYPILTNLFQNAAAKVDELGLSMHKPTGFTVEHVYLDSAAHASSSEFRMTSSPESYLKSRGYL